MWTGYKRKERIVQEPGANRSRAGTIPRPDGMKAGKSDENLEGESCKVGLLWDTGGGGTQESKHAS